MLPRGTSRRGDASGLDLRAAGGAARARAGARRRAHRLAATAPALEPSPAWSPRPAGRPVERARARRAIGTREHQGVALLVGDYPYAAADELLGADAHRRPRRGQRPAQPGRRRAQRPGGRRRRPRVPRHRSASVTPAAVKASAGATEHLPVAHVTNVVGFLKRAQRGGLLGLRGRREARLVPRPRPHRPRGRSSSAPRAAGCGRSSRAPATPLPRSRWTGRGEPQRERRRGAPPLRGPPPARAPARRRSRQGEPVSRDCSTSSTATTCCTRSSAARPRRSLRRRDWLADQPRELRRAAGRRAVLVFDGTGPPSPSCEPVKGTPRRGVLRRGRFTADTLIARRIAEQPADVAVVVVSADQEVQRTAARAGVQPHDAARSWARDRRLLKCETLQNPTIQLECAQGLRIKLTLRLCEAREIEDKPSRRPRGASDCRGNRAEVGA